MKNSSKNNNGNQEKIVIFDSSTLINLVMNGLLREFEELKKMFKGRFLITKEVYFEIIEKPMTIKRFKLEALKIKRFVDEKIIEMPSALGIEDRQVSDKTKDILFRANNIFVGKGNPIQIIHSGEASCFALSSLLNEKKRSNVISVDERTTRMLGEKPENLATFFERKLHTKIYANEEGFEFFKQFKFIRSTELMYIAYRKGIVTLKNHDVLDAILYALKLNGCSISDDEILEIERMK